MKIGFLRRGQGAQTEDPKMSQTDEKERKLQIWNEVLAMIRGIHPRCKGNPQYVAGVEPEYGLRFIPTRDIYHCLVTGLTGGGKSVFLLSQIIQDILRGDSVFVFDPHGDLAERILTHVPRDRWDDVVYVNPLTAREYGRVVRYNFLEVKEEGEPSLVKRSFMDALEKNYPEFWGPRLDAIIDHAIALLYEAPGVPTLPKLGRVLSKETYRESLLGQCKDEAVSDFWHSTFKKYRDDAITAAQNKLYRILEEKLIIPITSAERSTIDFGRLMQEGKIVIFDIREGALTSSITSFIGTLFLARIYQAGMARERIPEGERRRTRVYVDEASRFLTQVLKDNMQALRKYNIFLTVVCQNLDQFSGGTRIEGSISQYTNTVVAFQSSHETAKGLEGFFPKLPESRDTRLERHDHLERARFYHFYLSVLVGAKRENYYVRSIDVGVGENRPEEVIARSLEVHGERYDVHEKHPVLELPAFKFGPAAYFALSELEQRGEMSEESVQEKLGKFVRTAVTDALFKTLKDRGWATYEWREGQAGRKQRFWRITREGVDVLFPTTEIWGNRLGGAKHIAMLCLMCRFYREMGYYPMVVTGEREHDSVTTREGERKVDIYPDILLFSPYSETRTRYNPSSWDASRAIAVEIEAYPAGGKYTGSHLDRTKAHFVKARDILEMPVIFVVHTEGEADAVRRAIREEGASIVPDVRADYAPGNAAVRVLGGEFEKVKNLSATTELAMQIRKLCAMARGANISELAETEDFFEEKMPDYADHRLLEEMKRRESEAERTVAEEIKAERKQPKPIEAEKIEDIEPLESKEEKPAEEKPPVSEEKKRPQPISLEQPGRPVTSSVGPAQMKQTETLSDPSQDRKSKVVKLKQMGARWRVKKISEKLYVYARVRVDGKREEISLGQLDDEMKQILKENGVWLR